MNNKQKLQLCSIALTITSLLSGCANSNEKKIYAGKCMTDRVLTYNTESNVISGTITNGAMDYIRVVTFKLDDLIFTKLVAIEDYESRGARSSTYTLKYVDLESGTTLISASARTKEGELSYSIGENIIILEEKPILPFLYEAGILKDDYEVNEIISFYQENKDKFISDYSFSLR